MNFLPQTCDILRAHKQPTPTPINITHKSVKMPRTKYGQQELPKSSSRYYIFLTVSQNLERKRSYVFSRCASLMSRFFIYNVTLMFLRVSSTLLQYQVCVSNFNFLNSRSSNRPNTPFSLGSQANFFFVQAFSLFKLIFQPSVWQNTMAF